MGQEKVEADKDKERTSVTSEGGGEGGEVGEGGGGDATGPDYRAKPNGKVRKVRLLFVALGPGRTVKLSVIRAQTEVC